MKPFIHLLLIIFLCINIASAYGEDDPEWTKVSWNRNIGDSVAHEKEV